MNRLKELSNYFICLGLLLAKGLIFGLGWPEAIVSCILIVACGYENFLKVVKENKVIENQKQDESLLDRIKSLESKMVLAGFIKRK